MTEQELREEHYAHLRIQKRRRENALAGCLCVAALVGTVELLAFGTVDGIRFFGESVPLGIIIFCLNLGIFAGMILGICKRNYYLTGAAIMLWILNSLLHLRFLYIGTTACLFFSMAEELRWHRLRQEEGFPLFEVPIREQEQSGAAADLTARKLPAAEPTQEPARPFTPGEMDSI